MIPFFHGFGIVFYFPLVWAPFFLLGYLISDKIKRLIPRLIWIGVLSLSLIACDIVFLMRNYDKAGYLLLMVVSWLVMQMILGQVVSALVNAIRAALTKNRKENAP